MKTYNILIAEDSKMDRFWLRQFLGNKYNIVEAEDGLEALSILKDGFPADLVISDLLMPNMSGKELLCELAKFKNLKEFPVLIATSDVSIDVELECLNLGCADFIRKPYNVELLIMRVENTLERMEYSLLKQNSIKNVFSKFVDPTVVGSVLEPNSDVLITQPRDVTVMFADIRRFTTISEKLPPKEVLELLNRSFEITSSSILKYGGVLDKYIGDCTMAFWGAPAESSDGAYLACCAAVDMMKKTKELFSEYSIAYGIDVALGIGINTGTVIAGCVGSSDRVSYTVIGDAVSNKTCFWPCHQMPAELTACTSASVR